MLEAISFQYAIHDGGVIIKGDRIAFAASIFRLPTPGPEQIPRTRHRAAIGLSEETDAVVVVVSEETGAIFTRLQGPVGARSEFGRIARISDLSAADASTIRNWLRWLKSWTRDQAKSGAVVRSNPNAETTSTTPVWQNDEFPA